MFQNNKNKSSKWWLLFKLLLAICALLFIFRKVLNHENSSDYLSQLTTAVMQPGAILLFITVFILMVLNWLTEAEKWRFMIAKIESVKLSRSFEAVLSGLTFSFFTPNRIGEYAGRVFHLQQGKRMQATFITVIENSSQLLITILTGTVAFMIYMTGYMEMPPWMFMLIRFLLSAFCIFCLILYYNLQLFENVFLKLKMTDYWRQIFHVFSLYNFKELTRVLFLSLIRYIIFSAQFILLLRVYGSTFDLFPGIIMVMMTFFVMSVVPTFTFAEIGVRGAVSAYFFGKITIDVLPVLNAAFSLWLINLAIPALAGAFFIFHFRLEKDRR